MLLLSRLYTNEITFAPLQSSVPRGDPPSDAKIQWRQSCSPRSAYSLAASVGILRSFMVSGFNKSKSLESKIFEMGHLRTSSPNSLLRTSYKNCSLCSPRSTYTANLFVGLALTQTFSHKAVMDIEIDFFHKNSAEKNPTLLIEYTKKVASGEAQFFSKTVSLVYGKLVEKNLSPPIPGVLGIDPGNHPTHPGPPPPARFPPPTPYGYYVSNLFLVTRHNECHIRFALPSILRICNQTRHTCTLHGCHRCNPLYVSAIHTLLKAPHLSLLLLVLDKLPAGSHS